MRQLLHEKHLLTAAHTLSYWPRELYLPGAVFDRVNRETWMQEGGRSLDQRVKGELERLLATYASPQTDPLVDAELIRMIKAGLTTDQPLPEVLPPVLEPRVKAGGVRERRGRGRRPG